MQGMAGTKIQTCQALFGRESRRRNNAKEESNQIHQAWEMRNAK